MRRRLLKSMRTPREQGMRQLGDGGPGFSWARASGGDFTTASLRVNASTRRIRKLSPGLASEVTWHVFFIICVLAVVDALVDAGAALTKETNGSRVRKSLDAENMDIAPCDTPGLGVGDLCEGDGECGTDRKLDNCSNDEAQGADIYRIVDGAAPNYKPTKRPTTDCPSGITDDYGQCVDEGCASWYDGCNTCAVRDGRLDACTEMYCDTPKEPKCLESDANGCADDPSWCYGDCSPNDCAYVSQKVKPDGTLARCKKKNTDGERSALEACPVTCGTCP